MVVMAECPARRCSLEVVFAHLFISIVPLQASDTGVCSLLTRIKVFAIALTLSTSAWIQKHDVPEA